MVAIEVNDPCYLHPSDHPGLVLVTPPFNGRNYSEWRRSMRIALSAKNKVGFVTGSVKSPAKDSEKYCYWERCNDMVISWLISSLSSEIRRSVIYIESASGIWEELESRYGKSNNAQVYCVQKELNACVQGASTGSEYFTRLKTLWDELGSLKSSPACSCGGLKAFLKYEMDQKVFHYLMGLNDAYSSIRSAILMMKPLPSLSEAYSIVSEDETQRGTHSRSDSDSAAMYASSGGTGANTKTGGDQKFCTNCKKHNHMVDKCWFIIGFPPNRQGQNKRNPNQPQAMGGSKPTAVAGHVDDAQNVHNHPTADRSDFSPAQIAKLRHRKSSSG